jgi:hypothetical protein
VHICCSVNALSFLILLDSIDAFSISVEEAPFFSSLEELNEKYVCVSPEFFRVCTTRCSEAGCSAYTLSKNAGTLSNKADCSATELTSIVCVHPRGGEPLAVAVLGGIARKIQQ